MRPLRPLLMHALARFARAERGATAVEFALISLPLVTLLFAIIELVLVFTVTTVLETATETASRQIRTGEAAGSSKAAFKTMVCNQMLWMQATCAADLTVDVRTFATFGAMAANQPLAPATFDPAATCWAPGQPGDIVLVRIYYKWPLITPLLSTALANAPGGVHLLNTTTAFRNEPYNDNPPGGAAC
ncbi:MAG: TadE/TadG family type IV pilus assembly protein [Phenylobacterium sp.]